jgi:hypothetical protein
VYNQGVTAFAAAWCAITVALTPVRLQMGAPRAQAKVVVSGLPSKSSHVRLWASLGTVSAAHATGPGQVEALYQPPAAGAPAFAVVAAWDEASGEAAVATVELEARTEIPVETEPGVQVSVAVGNHHGIAHADAKGHATALVWVAPGLRSARVTAQDAAGNATTAEVALDIPTPERVWLVERGDPAGDSARLYAFTLQLSVPVVRAAGGVAFISSQPGIATITVRGHGDAMVTAIVGDSVARRALHLGSPPPLPPEVVVVELAPAFVDPRDDLGASVGPRFSGSFIDAAATLEWRRRLRRSRFHLGLDVGALYATGTGAAMEVRLGGAFARAIGEARFYPSERAALTVGVGLGGALVGERRTPLDGNDYTATDGGPSVGAQVGLLARMGPGVVSITLGFYYTPLLGLDRAILDGGTLSVGYRSIRF